MIHSYNAAWTFRHPLRPQTRLRLVIERRRGDAQHTMSLIRLGQLGKISSRCLSSTQAPNFEAGMVPVGPGIMPVARVVWRSLADRGWQLARATFAECGRPAQIEEEFQFTAGEVASDLVAAMFLPVEVVHVAEHPGAEAVLMRERAAFETWADKQLPFAAAG